VGIQNANYVYRLKADGKQFDATVQNSTEVVGKFDNALKKTGNTAETSEKKLKKSERGFDQLRGSVGKVRSSLLGVKSVIAGVIGSLGVREVYESTRAWQGYYSGLLAVTGSHTATAKEILFVRREAKRLGLDVHALVGGYTKLSAAAKGTALSQSNIRDIFSSTNEVAKVFNLTADQTRGALLAMEQMISKGTVSAEELRGQLGERIPGAFQMAARAMGVTTSELDSMLKAGSILAEDLLPKLAVEMRKAVVEGLPEATSNSAAEVGRLKNAWDGFLKLLSAAGIDDMIKSGAKSLTSFFDWAGSAVFVLAGNFKTGMLQIQKVFSVFGIAIKHMWYGLFNSLKEGAALFFEGFGKVASFIPGAGGFSKDAFLAAENMRKSKTEIDSLSDALRKSNAEYNKLIGETKMATAEKVKELRIEKQLIESKKALIEEQKQSTAATEENSQVMSDAQKKLIAELLPAEAAATAYYAKLAELEKLKPHIAVDQYQLALAALNEKLLDIIVQTKKMNNETKEVAQNKLLAELIPAEAAAIAYYAKLAELEKLKPHIAVDQYRLALTNLNKSLLSVIVTSDDNKEKTKEVAQAYKDMSSGIQSSFAATFRDIFKNGIDGFRGFFDRIHEMFISLLAEMAARAAAARIVAPIMVSSGAMDANTAGAMYGAPAANANPWVGAGLLVAGAAFSAYQSRKAREEQRAEEARRRRIAAMQIMERLTSDIESNIRLLSGASSEAIENLRRMDTDLRLAFKQLGESRDVLSRAQAEQNLFDKMMARYQAEADLLDNLQQKIENLNASLLTESESIDAAIRTVSGVPDYRNPTEIITSVSSLQAPTLDVDPLSLIDTTNEIAGLNTLFSIIERLDSDWLADRANDDNIDEMITSQNRFFAAYNASDLANVYGQFDRSSFSYFSDSDVNQRINDFIEDIVTDLTKKLDDANQLNTDQLKALVNGADDYAEALQGQIDVLRDSREEVVRWYNAQKQLAATLQQASGNIENVLTRLRRSQMTTPARTNDRLAEFRDLATKALSADGYELASSANALTQLVDPLLADARNTYASGSGYQAIYNEIMSTLGEVQDRVDTLTPQGYEEAALTALDTIDKSINDLSKDLRDVIAAIEKTSAGVDESTKNALIKISESLGGDINIQIVTPDGQQITEQTIDTLEARSAEGEVFQINVAKA